MKLGSFFQIVCLFTKKIPLEIQRRIYYAPIHVEFIGDREERFLHQLEQYVTTNQKYSVLHPE